MLILAIDTSAVASAALVSSETPGSVVASFSTEDTRSHAEVLAPGIEEMLAGAGVTGNDIDLENTMDSSVTVVEWGRDRVEHLSESRLEIDLHRAVGLDDGRPSSSLDFDTEDADEPRTIVMRGYGPRWPEAPELGAAMEGAR